MALSLSVLLALATTLLTVALAADLAQVDATASAAENVRLALRPRSRQSPLQGAIPVANSAAGLPLRKVAGPAPAVTIQRFQALTSQAETMIRTAVRRGLAEPGPFFSDAVRQRVDSAVTLLQQATQALDLSQVPVALRPMTGVGTMLMLRSLLAYNFSQSPNLAIPAASAVKSEKLTSWTIPDTTITLTALTPAQVNGGQACAHCSAGDFVFSSSTLARVPDDFEQVFEGKNDLQRRFGADLYFYWAMMPGGALPPKLFLVQPIELRRFLLAPIAGQSLLQWILLIPVTILMLAVMVWWIWNLRIWKRNQGTLQGVGPQLLGLLAVLPLLLLVWAWQWYAIAWINLIGPREAAVLVLARLGEGLLMAALAYLGAETLGQLLSRQRRAHPDGAITLERRKGSGQILTVARIVGVISSLLVIVGTGQDLGLTSITLLGLASVPALAISLGTQQLIRDISDGFSLLLDGQIQLGDRCTIGTAQSSLISGQIVSMGMRSMRIQQEDGSMLSIPNSQVASSVVTNHRFGTVSPLKLSLPIATEALPQVQALLERAQQLLTNCTELSDAAADIEAGDAGWNLRLQGRWDSTLPKADLNAAKQRLHLQLIALTHSAQSARQGS
ncbi:MAG: mechanosensitive ion channel family protein [Synechococcaceae cyanobacterium]